MCVSWCILYNFVLLVLPDSQLVVMTMGLKLWWLLLRCTSQGCRHGWWLNPWTTPEDTILRLCLVARYLHLVGWKVKQILSWMWYVATASHNFYHVHLAIYTASVTQLSWLQLSWTYNLIFTFQCLIVRQPMIGACNGFPCVYCMYEWPYHSCMLVSTAF